MASLLKAVRLSSSGLFGRSKHKKLPEEWDDSIKQPVVDGITFYVKYLGSTLVEEPNGQQATADAIKTIISMVKASSKKLARVALTVNPKGIASTDLSTGENHLEFSIYRISFCSADANFDRVVAFIATNKNETLECHAFLCSKRKVAQAAALTISQAFSIAFDLWERAREERISNENKEDRVNCDLSEDMSSSKKIESETSDGNQVTLIDLSVDGESACETMRKLGFENDRNLNDSFSRLAHSRSHPMFSTALNPEDIKDLQQFVQSQEKTQDRDYFLNDQSDDLFL